MSIDAQTKYIRETNRNYIKGDKSSLSEEKEILMNIAVNLFGSWIDPSSNILVRVVVTSVIVSFIGIANAILAVLLFVQSLQENVSLETIIMVVGSSLVALFSLVHVTIRSRWIVKQRKIRQTYHKLLYEGVIAQGQIVNIQMPNRFTFVHYTFENSVGEKVAGKFESLQGNTLLEGDLVTVLYLDDNMSVLL